MPGPRAARSKLAASRSRSRVRAASQAKTAAAGQANLEERRRLSDQTASAIDLRLGNNPREARLAKTKGCDLKSLNPP